MDFLVLQWSFPQRRSVLHQAGQNKGEALGTAADGGQPMALGSTARKQLKEPGRKTGKADTANWSRSGASLKYSSRSSEIPIIDKFAMKIIS